MKKGVENLKNGDNAFAGQNTFKKSVTIEGVDQKLILQSGEYYNNSRVAINNNGEISFKPVRGSSTYNIKLPQKPGTIALTADVAAMDPAKKIEVTDSGVVNKRLYPDYFYDFTGNLTKLTISLADNDSSKAYEYKGQFKTGATAPTVIFPSNVKMIGSSIEANKTYQFSIVNNIGVVIGV